MSHQIDDIFKRSLGDLSDNDGLDQNWQEARELLDLKKRKRKALFWLWGFGSAAVLIILIASLYSMSNGNLDETLRELKPPNATQEKVTANSNSPSMRAQDFLAQTEVDQGEGSVQQLTRTQPSSQVTRKVVPQTKPKSSKKISGTNEISKGITKDLSPVILSTSNNENPTLENDRVNTQSLENTIEVPSSRTRSSIVFIKKLALSPLSITYGVSPLPMNHKLVPEQKQRMTFHLGLFASYSFKEMSPALGTFVATNLGSKFTLDIGLGVSRFSNGKDESLSGFAFDNQRGVTGELTSNNAYSYYSLKMPIRLHYVYRDVSIFGGVTFERPFVLKGRQEVSLLPENSDLDMPMSLDPLTNLGNEPIMTIQDYSLRNVSELDRFFMHTIVGIGYRPSAKWQLSSIVNYRLTSKRELSPLVDNVNLSDGAISKLLFKLRIDYSF